jgi:probable S-adenosylmethionine-dependent methyltransferase, YraL family
MIDFGALGKLCDHQSAEPGKLYVVATPLGNLADLTLRAIRILETCDCIACETPKVTQRLLAMLDIQKKNLFTYRDAGETKSAQHLLEYLQQGQSVALVSDAGTPTISDPGYRLVKLCREQSVEVVPIPGASATITALSASGFPCHQFLFLGFLPIKNGAREKILKAHQTFEGTLIIYESPYRVRKLLNTLKELYGNFRRVCIARELTKINESFYQGQLSALELSQCPERGEYVILVAPEEG